MGNILLSPKSALGVCLLTVAALNSPKQALAMTAPPPTTMNGGPLGTLNVSGGVDGYFYGLSGANSDTLLGSDKSNGGQLRIVDLKIVKPTGQLQFTFEVNLADALYMGIAPGSLSNTVNTYTLGPIYEAYVTLAPTKNLNLSIGEIPSVEGVEYSDDWNNFNIVYSALYYVQNASGRGVSVNYTHGPLAATVVYGDGFDSGVFNVVQAVVTDNFNANNSLAVYGAANLGRTGPNTFAYGNYKTGYGYSSFTAAYVNSDLIGSYYYYINGNLTLAPQIQYVYAKVDHRIGIDKYTSNFGVEMLSDYQFGSSPWSLGSQVQYYRNNGGEAWYLNAHSAGVGIGVTPTWQEGHIFARAEATLLHLTDLGTGPGFGGSGTARNQVMGLLEAGLMY